MTKMPDLGFTWDYLELSPEPTGATHQEVREMLMECACALERTHPTLAKQAKALLQKGRT